MKAIFIAGAYHGKSPYMEIDRRIRLAERSALALWKAGYGAFCPHLNTAHFEAKALSVPESAYKEFDKRMLRCCDAVLALPNWRSSEGATEEIQEAGQLEIPVYFSLRELKANLDP